MRYKDLIEKIQEIVTEERGDFQKASRRVEQTYHALNTESILEHLGFAGIIPEMFGHDSTEEKLYAKYCDILVAQSLTHLGISSKTILERADAPDVEGTVSHKYKLVADAKAFRLSRTAKNQKDFKVESLAGWREDAKADYALLVGPMYQFPTVNSQIYEQSIDGNVAMLSYTHLHFMIRSNSGGMKDVDLEDLWKAPGKLTSGKDAVDYWNRIDAAVKNLFGKPEESWTVSKKRSRDALLEIGKEQIEYWRKKEESVRELSHEQAVKQLIKALKIPAKIKTIQGTMEWS